MPPGHEDASGDNLQPPAPPATAELPLEPHPRRAGTQWLMLLCVIASFALFWSVGNLVSIPRYRGFNASLLQQGGVGAVALTLLTLLVLVFGVTLVVEIVARRFWLFAGPLAALVGLSAWSFRGGPSYFSFITPTPTASSVNAFRVLALECLLYGVVLAALWLLIYRVFHPPQKPDEKPFSLVPTGDVIQVVLTQAAFTALGVIILVPSPQKQQAVLGLTVASGIAAGLTRYFYDSRAPSRWIWAAPILVGAVGYLVNSFGPGAVDAVETGRLSGTFAALARPLPLDYATAGVVGALLGLAMTTHEWEMATVGVPAAKDDQTTAANAPASPAQG